MTNTFDAGRLGLMVRARRGGRGLREVAAQIGCVSPSTLSRVENGRTPDMDTLLYLCDWLGVPAASFFAPARPDGDELPASAVRVIARIHAAPALADAIEAITTIWDGGKGKEA